MGFNKGIERGLAIVLALLWVACSQKEARVPTVERDLTITPENAFTQLFLDSTQLAGYVEEESLDDSLTHLLYNFYNSRNYQLAWFTEDGVAEQTQAFYTLYHKYITNTKASRMVWPNS